jgi:hypothetical protein
MRNTKPTARVVTAKTVINATARAKVFITMDMFVKIEYTATLPIIDLAGFCGVAPCQILAANKCGESELAGRVIDLPISTPAFIRPISWFYGAGDDGCLKKLLHPVKYGSIINHENK